jgi:hypothetical protein
MNFFELIETSLDDLKKAPLFGRSEGDSVRGGLTSVRGQQIHPSLFLAVNGTELY